jgi:transcriptional regulator
MHIQPLFAETGIDALHRLIRSYPLATLTMQTTRGLDAHLLPLELVEAGPHGCLRGHVSRQHPLCIAGDGSEALAIFQGPNAYISPRWYVSGRRSGRNAPSWNYVAVQAVGRLRLVDDRTWLRTHLAALAHGQEAHRDEPWSLDQAPAQFVDDALQRLVGFEIDIRDLCGKRFLSQQRTEADRHSLVQHLASEPAGMARDLAALLR